MGTKLKITLGILGLLILGYLVTSIIVLQKGEAQISASQAEVIKPGLLPNLSLSVTDGVDKVKSNDKVNYEIKLQNLGSSSENELKMVAFIATPTEVSPLLPDFKKLLEECIGSKTPIGLKKTECSYLFSHPSFTEALGILARSSATRQPNVIYKLKIPTFTWTMDKFLANAEMVKKIPLTISETQSPTIVTTVYVYQRWSGWRIQSGLSWAWPWRSGNWVAVAVARDIDMVER